MRSITTFIWLCCALAALMAVAKPIRSNSGGDGTARSGGQPLPYDSKVQYLQSTGSEVVIIPASIANTISRYSLDCAYAALGNGAMVTSAGYLGLGCYAGRYQIFWARYGAYRTSISGSTRVTFDMDMAAHSWTLLSPSGSTLESGSDGNIQPTSGMPLRLFSTTSAGVVPAQARVYGFVAYSGDSIALDLIPVRKDGLGFMYDRVSGQLFGNEGTGAFVLGPDVP